jgi:hypothetical protein
MVMYNIGEVSVDGRRRKRIGTRQITIGQNLDFQANWADSEPRSSNVESSGFRPRRFHPDLAKAVTGAWANDLWP